MIRKYLFTCTVLILTVFPYISSSAQAAQIEVAGKHMRSDGSVYDFEVVDGDALSPGDRFQIIIDSDKNTFYAILYFSRDGKATQIFPQAGERGLIRAGARQYIPGADNYFTLDVNGGRELMFVVTSPNELSNLKSVLRGAESVSSPIEINAYLQKRLPRVQKLEITNTGKRIASSTDQVSSSLVRDIERTYAKNPWPDTSASDGNNKSRVRRGDDNSIPEAVRRRTAEVRSLLKTPRGTTGSSSLRTVQVTPSQTIGVPAGGEIRRDTAMLMAQKEKQAEEARLRQERLGKEERQRQQQIAVAKQEREAAEANAKKLQEEREVAERLEAQRIAEAEAVARELELKRQAIVKSEAEARLQVELREEQEHMAEQTTATGKTRKYEAERLIAEEAKHLEIERRALAETEALAQRIEEDRLLAEQQRQEKERAEAKAKQLAEQHAAEEIDRLAAEARRQAEIAAEEESIRAEQEALEEKLRLAKEEEAARDEEGDKGIFSQMLALVSGDKAEKTTADTATVVVETDSTGEVILNEPVAESQIEFTNSAAAAPREAVVVLQAPLRPVEKKMSAPAPVRITLEDGKPMDKAAASDMAAQIASAIVSISTSNDPQASGFILDSKGHILTAWHVINGVTDINVSFMAISGASRVFKAKVVKHDKFHDLALLQLVNPPEGIQPITVSGDELPDAGSAVRVFGQKDGQIWATDDAVITRIAEHFTWFSQDNVIHRGEVLQIDLPPEGKDIGSLVTTMDYQLLGMKSFSGSQTGRTYAVSVRMIRDFVEAEGVAAGKSGTPSR